MAIHRGATLPAVTGIRFPAAALVMIGHAATVNSWAAPLGAYKWWNAVPFFFLLSGFILAHVYPSLDGWQARKQFLLARFARVYPLHLATMMLVVLALPEFARSPLNDPVLIITNLTLTQSWSWEPNIYFAYNSPAWSISVEMFLYACFPLLILRWRYTWWLCLPAAAFLNVYASDLWPQYAQARPLPLRHLFLFAMGISTASLYRWLEPRAHWGRLAGTVLELAAGAVLFYCDAILPYPYHEAGAALGYASVVLVMALGRGWISQVFAWRPIVVLGEASFALYMLHQIVLRWMLVHGFHASWDPGTFFITYVGISLAGSYALWRYIECPARRLILASVGQRRRTAVPQVVAPEIANSPAVSSAAPKPHFALENEHTPRENRSSLSAHSG